MPPAIICAPFQPCLEKTLMDTLSLHPPGPGRLVAVVSPSRRMSERLQRLIAREQNLPLLNIRFHTFFTLAMEVLDGSAEPDRVVVGDELFHDKLVDSLLRAAGRETRRLSPGLSAAYRASIRDLAEAGVEPALFREHFSDVLKTGDLGRRLEFLLTLQEKYLERLEEMSVLPVAGLERVATRLLEEGKSSALEKYGEFLYYGFYNLNGTQADFFSSVVRMYPATVFFPYRKDHPAFSFAERFYQLKLPVGGAEPIHLRGRSPDGSAKKKSRPRLPGGAPCEGPPALGRALDGLFDPVQPAVTVPEEKLKIINVSGLRDEVWRVAKEILALRERPKNPVEFDDIGIVARSMDPYRGVLAEVLAENGIPFSLRESEPLRMHPIAKLTLLFLTLRRRDYPAGAVLDVLESPYFRLDRFQGRVRGGRLLDHWKQLADRLGVHSGWLQWRGKLAPWAKKDFELFPQLAAEGRPGYRIAREDTAALWNFLEDLHRRLAPTELQGWTRLADYARALLEENFKVEAGDPDAPAWAATLEVFEDLKAFDMLDPNAGWDVFLETLEEKLMRAGLEPPEGRRGVRVFNAMDARGDSFRVLFLIGLREGFFPRQVREDPLLRDSLRALLQQPGGYWISPRLGGYDEEKLLFYLMVSSAREKLYCLYARSDDSGKAQVPSIYLRELCRAAGRDLESDPGERVPRQPWAKLDALPPSFLSPKEAALLLARDGEDPGPLLEPLGTDSKLLKDCLDRVTDMNRFGEPHALDGIVGHTEGVVEGLLTRGLSPTAMDVFGTCPFQFYASRVLGLREIDEATDRSDLARTVRGRIYHLLMQRFHEKIAAQGYWKKPSSAAGDWVPLLKEVMESVFREFSWEGTGTYPLFWESVRRQMAVNVRRVLERDMAELTESGYVPSVMEKELRVPAPLELTGPMEKLEFRGQPDRVDVQVSEKKFRIIDYKTRWPGWKKSLASYVLSSQAHQPPVYLEMVSHPKSGLVRGLSPSGVCYYIMEDSPSLTGAEPVQEFPAEVWKAHRSALLKNLAGFVQQMERGEFFIVPKEGQGGHCTHCPFGAACRKSHPPTRRRAEESVLREEYEKLKSVEPKKKKTPAEAEES
ncbi:MAG TPA: exodeoxyribonuclease V subunit gamma [Elusimicrobiota bacterium]|nr:exodeoxyribonuclease V subunit gamma [Elusimicrobiota bacterium]